MTPHSRREFLQNSGLGFGALALGDLLASESRAEDSAANLLAARPPQFPGTAKSIIFLFMQGGPSHLETFDPKPLMRKFDGQLLPESLRNFDLAQINTADSKVMHRRRASGVQEERALVCRRLRQ